MKPFRELTIFEEPLCRKPGKNEIQTRFPTATSDNFPKPGHGGKIGEGLIRFREADPMPVAFPYPAEVEKAMQSGRPEGMIKAGR